jgi:hypothetical protein
VYNPSEAPSPAQAPSPQVAAGGAVNPRYVYLSTRLRNRQITMEEATELFGMMQAMLRASETARLMALRAAPMAAPPPVATGAPVPPPTGVRVVASSSDDFLLMGILALGAGAGLLAAMTKRIQEGPAPSSAAHDARST